MVSGFLAMTFTLKNGNKDNLSLRISAWGQSQNKKFRTVLDIGAWCGTWSKAIEPYAKTVVAYEPDKTHFACLERNCTQNCKPMNLAVGSTVKNISLTEDDFTQAKRVNDDGDIPMVTIDNMDHGDIDLIKIDVEGYEMEVLRGGRLKLPLVKYIMIELNNNTKKYGSSNLDVEKYLKELGFKVLMEHWPDKIFYNTKQIK
jgi:FkbM family methyltransferase